MESSLDKHRAKEIYKDMQNYTNGIIKEIEHRINQDKEDTVSRINEVLELLEKRVHKDKMKQIFDKVDDTEKYITNVAINNNISQQKLDLENTEAGLSRYLEQIKLYNDSINRLERKMDNHEDKLN